MVRSLRRFASHFGVLLLLFRRHASIVLVFFSDSFVPISLQRRENRIRKHLKQQKKEMLFFLITWLQFLPLVSFYEYALESELIWALCCNTWILAAYYSYSDRLIRTLNVTVIFVFIYLVIYSMPRKGVPQWATRIYVADKTDTRRFRLSTNDTNQLEARIRENYIHSTEDFLDHEVNNSLQSRDCKKSLRTFLLNRP